MTDIAAINKVVITGEDTSGPAFASAIDNVKKLGAAATNITGAVQTAFAAIGAGAFAAAITGAIDMEASLSRLAQRTGATVESLSAMRTAAQYAGVDIDQVAKTLALFANNVTKAASGTGLQADALTRLGFDAKTFAAQYSTTDEAILAVAQRLSQYQDGLGKTAIAQQLLGRSGAALLPFMQELADRGLDNVKVTAQEAQAARDLEDSWTKLKQQMTAVAVAIANTLIPVLSAVVSGFDTFKQIAIAAAIAFITFPPAVALAASALTAYSAAAETATLRNTFLGASTTATAVLMQQSFATTAASFTTLFGTAAALAKTLPALLFAGFTGFKLGEWLRDNFEEARVYGLYFVQAIELGWADLKYAGQTAWEAVKLAFTLAVENMKQGFGEFVVLVGQGLSHIPALSGFSADVIAFGNSLQGGASTAITQFNSKVAALAAENDKARTAIKATIGDLVDYEMSAKKTAAATAGVKPLPPPPPGVKEAYVDLSKALAGYGKALTDLAVAYSASEAKQQEQAISNALADLDKSYARGLTDFAQYWEQRTNLQKTNLAVEQNQLEEALTAQVQQVEALQQQIVALDPSKFKSYGDYLKAVYELETKLIQAYSGEVKALGEVNVVKEKATQTGKDYFEQLQKEYPAILQSNDALKNQVAQQQLANETIGVAASAVQLYVAAQDEKLLADQRAAGADDKTIAAMQKQIALRQQLAGTLKAGEDLKQQLDLVQQGTDALATGLVGIVQKGKTGFQDLWNNFKQWGLEAIAKIAAQRIVLSIVAAISPSLASAAGASFGAQGNPLSSLSSLFGGGSGLGGLLSLGQVAGDAFLPGAIAPGTLGGFADSLGLGAIAPLLGTLGPLVPLLGLAIPLLAGLFKKEPSAVQGQFSISSGTTGFEDNAFTASKFGNIGFSDVGTQQFSGEAAQVFNKIVSGALDAFATRFSPEQSAAFAAVLKNMTFQAFSGTFTTEDFLQKYGGQVLQQVVQAAFSTLDPALASVEAGFKGTADEIATFTNSLLSIYDLTKNLPADLKANIESGLVDATQETADKVTAFATILVSFGDVLPGLRDQFGALTGQSIPDFIDALGGAKAAFDAFNYLNANFLTSSQRMANATATLNSDFTDLGLAIPQTHQQFLDLLNSFDLTTSAGQHMYASVLALAPLFVQVHGTADDAAQSLGNVSNALSSAAQSAQDFFNQNFYSDAEKQAKTYADDLKQVSDAQVSLGITIPTTVEGFRKLIEGIDRTTPAGEALYEKLIVLAPAIYDIANATKTAATTFTTAANAIISASQSVSAASVESSAQKAVDAFGKKVDAILSQSTGDFGDKTGVKIGLFTDQINNIQEALNEAIATYGQFSNNALVVSLQDELKDFKATNAQLGDELARFTVLKAQYGSGIAEQLVSLQDWYTQQQGIFHNNSDALAALIVIFNQKWASIIAGTSTGVTGVTSQLDALRKAILDYANSLTLGNLSPLSPQQQLVDAQSQYAAELAKAQGGDQSALGDVTKFADTYLNLARTNFASGQQYTDIFNAVQSALRTLGSQVTSDPVLPAAPQAVATPTANSATSQIAAALPSTGGKLASSDDIRQMVKQLIAALMDAAKAQADAGTDDAASLEQELAQTKLAIVDAIASHRK
ncbi:MAG: hypothetical protein ACRENK_15590 [Gemmatimonadaceae bacterium]